MIILPRTCLVIMPFSTTTSCEEDEWTLIFESIFNPAIEDSGLDEKIILGDWDEI